MSYRDGGKGDKPRPLMDRKLFEKNFEAIFGNKKKAKIDEVDHGVYIIEVVDRGEDDGNNSKGS